MQRTAVTLRWTLKTCERACFRAIAEGSGADAIGDAVPSPLFGACAAEVSNGVAGEAVGEVPCESRTSI